MITRITEFAASAIDLLTVRQLRSADPRFVNKAPPVTGLWFQHCFSAHASPCGFAQKALPSSCSERHLLNCLRSLLSA